MSKTKSFSSKAFELLYEDNFLLVVNKKAGVLTVPRGGKHQHYKSGRGKKGGSRPSSGTQNRGRQEMTLIGEIQRYLSIKSGRPEGVTSVHRLDMETSGVLLIAKSQKVAERLKEEFRQKKPERIYRTIVRGHLQESSGTFRSYLATDDDLNQFSTKKESQGKLAVTHFRRLQLLRDATEVEVTLETGRRNQIRVHFSEAGYPVLGDRRYEPELAAHPLWPHTRLALHAQLLGFFHPLLKRKFRFETPLPEEFVKFISLTKEP